MFNLGFVVLVALLSAVVGLFIGIGIHRGVSNAEAKARQLSDALADAEAQKDEYQQQVAQHFSQTAQLLNELTEKYKGIHQHLASGADQLCRDQAGNSLLSDLSGETSDETKVAASLEKHPDIPQPPLDYAPKTEGINTGTLAEDYGLEKVDLHQDQPAADLARNSVLADAIATASVAASNDTRPTTENSTSEVKAG